MTVDWYQNDDSEQCQCFFSFLILTSSVIISVCLRYVPFRIHNQSTHRGITKTTANIRPKTNTFSMRVITILPLIVTHLLLVAPLT